MGTFVRQGCMLAAASVLVAMTLGYASNAPASIFNDYEREYARGNYSEAIKLLKEAATQGDLRAQVELGHKYEKGEDIPQHYIKAVDLYVKAAAHDHAAAQYHLGLVYAEGRGVEQDNDKALEWFRKAAAHDHAAAQYHLGLVYAEGRGVEQDGDKALEWFRKAAAHDHAAAQYHLGLVYAEGRGVEQDNDKALEWFRKAAAHDHAAAQYHLGLVYAEGRGVEQDGDKALEWFRKAAAHDHAAAQYRLGLVYAKGRGVEQDDDKALEWFRKAVAHDHAAAQYRLGLVYAEGRGVEQDDDKALEWFRKAVAQDHAEAQNYLGLMFSSGRGAPRNHDEVNLYAKHVGQDNSVVQYQFGLTEQDDAKALEWFRKAADQGNVDAQFRLALAGGSDSKFWLKNSAKQGHPISQYLLGTMYLEGENDLGIEQDYAKALEWYKKAANQDPLGIFQFGLGLVYAEGRGVEQDDAKALEWFRKAAAHDNAAAQYRLGLVYAEGRGVEQDDAKALEWFRKAATRGHVLSSYELAKMAQELAEEVQKATTEREIANMAWEAKTVFDLPPGRFDFTSDEQTSPLPSMQEDITELLSKWIKIRLHSGETSKLYTFLEYKVHLQDILEKEAMSRFKRAAEEGYDDAQYRLGRMYEIRGERGYDRIYYAAAVKFYQKAAEQGHIDAQYRLGRMYENGLGVLRSRVHAHVWFNLAGSQFSDSNSQSPSPRSETIRNARNARHRIESWGLESNDLEEAQRLAEEYRPGSPPTKDLLMVSYPFLSGYGSGFLIDSDGYMLTNAHVVENCDRVVVGMSEPATIGKLLQMDRELDLALLKIKIEDSTEARQIVARIRGPEEIHLGDKAVVVGYPLQDILRSSEAKVNQGSVSALTGPFDDRRRIQIDVAINSGNSGGPVLDAAGNVMGVTVAKFVSPRGKVAQDDREVFQNVNYAVSLEAVKAFLRDNGVRYESAPPFKEDMEEYTDAKVAAMGRQFTMPVKCLNWNQEIPR